MERAADWIFSHAGELDSMDVDENPVAPTGAVAGAGNAAKEAR